MKLLKPPPAETAAEVSQCELDALISPVEGALVLREETGMAALNYVLVQGRWILYVVAKEAVPCSKTTP